MVFSLNEVGISPREDRRTRKVGRAAAGQAGRYIMEYFEMSNVSR
jgi:hypothetical protein